MMEVIQKLRVPMIGLAELIQIEILKLFQEKLSKIQWRC